MRECTKHGFGYTAWSWCGNGAGVNYLDVATGFSWSPFSNGSNFADGHSGNPTQLVETYAAATLSNSSNYTTNGSCVRGGGAWGNDLVWYYDSNSAYNNSTYNFGNFGLGKPGVAKNCTVFDFPMGSRLSTEMNEEQEGLSRIVVYPNPTQYRATFDFTLAEETPVTLTITNTLGKTVFSKNYGQLPVGSAHIELTPMEVSFAPSGIYLYRLDTGSQSHTGKLVVIQ